MMKFNLRPEDCEFFIDEENKTVVCVYEKATDLFVDFANENFKIETDFLYWEKRSQKKFYEKLKMPYRFVGRAVCGPNDEFNKEIGKIIAFSRLKDKVSRSFFKRGQTYINTYDKWLDEATCLLNDLGQKLGENMERRHAYIDELLGPEPEDDAE